MHRNLLTRFSSANAIVGKRCELGKFQNRVHIEVTPTIEAFQKKMKTKKIEVKTVSLR
jgi:hypothetical protein